MCTFCTFIPGECAFQSENHKIKYDVFMFCNHSDTHLRLWIKIMIGITRAGLYEDAKLQSWNYNDY